MSTLEERINKADNYSGKLKEQLDELLAEYKQIKESGTTHPILDLKDKFIALDYQIGNATTLALELKGIAEIKRKEAYTLAFLDERSEYDEETGRKTTVGVAEQKAFLSTAKESMLETQAESVSKVFRHYQSVCNNYITQLSQRVKGLQQESMNSKMMNQ